MDEFTNDELGELGQTIQRCVKPLTGWILVLVPPHDCADHEPGEIPVQVISNIKDTEWTAEVLTAGSQMFESGTYDHMVALRTTDH